ncbi:hypothetical protein HED60_18800 [Planctomycetales bacterium ZRK34]|nr:hypothetical protein HED60_18800 [Planctomycetales bacterium ZRK34]
MPITDYEQRRYDRHDLPAAYAGVRVRRPGRQRFTLRGHAYDISLGGAQIELDHTLTPGDKVDVELSLPGRRVATVLATARIIRLCGCDEPGPARMGLRFIEMADRAALADYLNQAA